MKESYVAMSKYLLKALPLNSQVLKDVSCLGPVKREKKWAVNAIGRLASMLPHIAEREVSLVKDDWKILQTEEIPDDWYMENSGQQKRIDTYWAKVLEIRTETGDLKYSLLSKVVKSFLAMPSGKANVERSLSDNKNTLTSERTNMTKETLAGLRRAKEYTRSCGGAHNIKTLSRDEF